MTPTPPTDAKSERVWQGQRDQDAHDAAVAAVKDNVRAPDVYDYGLAHRIVEAVLKIVDDSERARG